MTTYNITIMNLSRKQVLDQILSVHSGVTFQVKPNAEFKLGWNDPRKKHGKRMSPDTILVLTGKSAQKGSQRERILLEHEKLEKKHGIGSVTRKMLNKHIGGLSIDTTVIGQLIKGGFLRPNTGA